MTTAVFATVLFVAVLFMAWRRGAYALAFIAVLLGVSVANIGGPLDSAFSGIGSGIRSTLSTIATTLF